MYQVASPRQPTSLFIAIAALIYLPLIESLLPGLFGAFWVDPSFMAKAQPVTLMIKLIAVLFGLSLLERFRRQFAEIIKGNWPLTVVMGLSYLLGAVQLIFLALGLFMSLVFSAPANEQSQFTRYEDYAIWVQTIDPGAMGKAYHRVWMQCDLPLWRYRLAPIQTLDWMGDYEVSLDGEILSISSGGEESKLDLSKVAGCVSA
ncbi:hypothetical protein L1D40_13280 [Shewanella insulae]|uniref:hypothetical protein n=1 Tax=Shewanella insulae TaxID=2681496 RepID=UPI001EFE3786|nr:hypothetical protein [Shewanella insulae]MCG9756182.1 hypothetical protein [Shewanella insulae]